MHAVLPLQRTVHSALLGFDLLSRSGSGRRLPGEPGRAPAGVAAGCCGVAVIVAAEHAVARRVEALQIGPQIPVDDRSTGRAAVGVPDGGESQHGLRAFRAGAVASAADELLVAQEHVSVGIESGVRVVRVGVLGLRFLTDHEAEDGPSLVGRQARQVGVQRKLDLALFHQGVDIGQPRSLIVPQTLVGQRGLPPALDEEPLPWRRPTALLEGFQGMPVAIDPRHLLAVGVDDRAGVPGVAGVSRPMWGRWIDAQTGRNRFLHHRELGAGPPGGCIAAPHGARHAQVARAGELGRVRPDPLRPGRAEHGGLRGEHVERAGSDVQAGRADHGGRVLAAPLREQTGQRHALMDVDAEPTESRA